MFEKVSNLKTQLDSARAQIKAHGREALAEAFREFFAQHPEIPDFEWKHTRPFCDGDTTYFTVSGFSPSFSCEQLSELLGKEVDEDYRDDMLRDGLDYHLEHSEKPEAVAFSKILKEFKAVAADEDILELLFGDHKKITVTRDGQFEVENYYEDY